MIPNLILSTLILFSGCVVVIAILLFGAKFSENGKELETDPTWKDILKQLLRGYPLWIWIIAFLAFQPAISHILNTWSTSIKTEEWISNSSDFIGFIAIIIFIIIYNITDDNGELKPFKKSEGTSKKLLSYLRGVFSNNLLIILDFS